MTDRPARDPSVFDMAAAQVAAQLGETDSGPRATIWRVVRTVGVARTEAFVAQALEAEAKGGMLIPDGSRKRTLGGIFFYLVRTQITDAEALRINPAWRGQPWKRRAPAKPKPAAAPAPPPLPLFVWDEADLIITALTANVGDASTVKLTVIGRPTQVVERQGVVVVALRSRNAPTLPKGLPPLPSAPTMYMVFIQQKQWTKVQAAMQQLDDALIVDGYPVREPRFAGITVYATQVTTKVLQTAKRKEQAAI